MLSLIVLISSCASLPTEMTSPHLSQSTTSSLISPSAGMAQQSTPGTTTLDIEEEELKERGWVAVNTKDEASQLVDYQVVIPKFIPDGFVPIVMSNSGTFLIQIPGFGLPSSVAQVNNYPFVQQTYARKPSMPSFDEPYFVMNQSRDETKISGDPVDIAGRTGKILLLKGEGNNPARLQLSWSDGNLFFTMEGTLVDPIDETILMKIANSISPN